MDKYTQADTFSDMYFNIWTSSSSNNVYNLKSVYFSGSFNTDLLAGHMKDTAFIPKFKVADDDNTKDIHLVDYKVFDDINFNITGSCDPYYEPALAEVNSNTVNSKCSSMQQVCNFYKLPNEECTKFL